MTQPQREIQLGSMLEHEHCACTIMGAPFALQALNQGLSNQGT